MLSFAKLVLIRLFVFFVDALNSAYQRGVRVLLLTANTCAEDKVYICLPLVMQLAY